jgi:hypothetical protein
LRKAASAETSYAGLGGTACPAPGRSAKYATLSTIGNSALHTGQPTTPRTIRRPSISIGAATMYDSS